MLSTRTLTARGGTVDVTPTGIDNNEVPGLPVAQAAGYMETVYSGPIIVIMSQYAVLGTGKTIHSKGQMEHLGKKCSWCAP